MNHLRAQWREAVKHGGYFLTPAGEWRDVVEHYVAVEEGDIYGHLAETGDVRVRFFVDQMAVQFVRPLTSAQRKALLDESASVRDFAVEVQGETYGSRAVIYSAISNSDDADRVLREAQKKAKSMAVTAMPSWRGLSHEQPWWSDYEAVIATDANGRGRNFEVFTYGQPWATRHSLAEAKASLEEVYGPLPWKRVTMPKEMAIHYWFGPTTEFTDPLTMYVVDELPELGSVAHHLTQAWGQLNKKSADEVLLYRGINDWQARFVGLDDNGALKYEPYVDAATLIEEITEEWSNLGVWWGDEHLATFHGNEGVVIGAWFPASAVHEAHDADGVIVPEGTKGRVERVISEGRELPVRGRLEITT